MARQGRQQGKQGGGGGQNKNTNTTAAAGGGGSGGCLTTINCFAQPNNGKGMTMTPPTPLHLEKQHQGAVGDPEDKENTNITAALEGIRAMQEVLSRNKLGEEEVSGDRSGGNGNNPKKMLSSLDNVLQVGSPEVIVSAGASSSSTFTFKDSNASVKSSPNEATSMKANLSTCFDRADNDLVAEVNENEMMKGKESGEEISSSVCSTPTPRDVSSMFDDAMGSKNQTPSKSPTQMLAHSLWIKEQQDQHQHKAANGLASPVKVKKIDALRKRLSPLLEKAREAAPFAVGVALMAAFRMVLGGGGGKRAKGKNQNNWPTTFVKEIK
jgi:hypothetical protein